MNLKKYHKSSMTTIESPTFFPNFSDIIKDYFLEKTKIYLNENEVFTLQNRKKSTVTYHLGSEKNNIGIMCLPYVWDNNKTINPGVIKEWNTAITELNKIKSKNFSRIICSVAQEITIGSERLTPAEYYIKTRKFAIPRTIEIWEYDPELKNLDCIYPIPMDRKKGLRNLAGQTPEEFREYLKTVDESTLNLWRKKIMDLYCLLKEIESNNLNVSHDQKPKDELK